MITNKSKSLATLCAVVVGIISTTLNIRSVTFTPEQSESLLNVLNIGAAAIIKKFAHYKLCDVYPDEFLFDIKESIRLYGSEVDKEVQSKANEIFDTVCLSFFQSFNRLVNPLERIDIDDFVLQLRTKADLPVYTALSKISNNIVSTSLLLVLTVLAILNTLLFRGNLGIYFRSTITTLLIVQSILVIKDIVSYTEIDDDLKVPASTVSASTDKQLTKKANQFIAYCVQQVTIATIRQNVLLLAATSLLIGCLLFEKPITMDNLYDNPELNKYNFSWTLQLFLKLITITAISSYLKFNIEPFDNLPFDNLSTTIATCLIMINEKVKNFIYLEEIVKKEQTDLKKVDQYGQITYVTDDQINKSDQDQINK